MSDFKEPTPEELVKAKEQRDKMTKFYEENLPFAELQAKYHQAVATVSESRLKKLTCDIRYAEMIAPQESNQTSEKK